MKNIYRAFLLGLLFMKFAGTQAQVANRPYPVYDTKPVITQDPYLIDPAETGMTINWMTDTPSQAQIVYGEAGGKLTDTVEPQKNGLIPVGTLQSVRLNELEPGTRYTYKVRSRRVVKLKPYWPEMGKWVESPEYSFTTFDRQKSKTSFSVISDTHEHVDWINQLMKKVDWKQTDFFVETGDALNYIKSEQQIFDQWLAPITKGLQQTTPLIYARGNHDLRGPFARNWFDYVPIHEGNFYFARDQGPAHFIVIDSGEDKPDTTNVYSGLNRLKEYRQEEYKWFEHHVKTSKSLKEAPFRILLIHDPKWGFTGGKEAQWTALANKAKVDLVIAGHWHRFKRIAAGEEDNEYPILVIGQKQIAHVEVTKNTIVIEVRDMDDQLIDSFQLDRKGVIKEH